MHIKLCFRVKNFFVQSCSIVVRKLYFKAKRLQQTLKHFDVLLNKQTMKSTNELKIL